MGQLSSSSEWVPVPTTAPSERTKIRSECMAETTRWVMTMRVRPASFSLSALRTLASVRKSRAEKESSKI